MPEYYRPQLKRESRERLRAAAPNVYLVAVILLVLNNLPSMILQRGLYAQLLANADNFDQMMEVYRNWSLQTSSGGLQLATFAMNLFLMVLGFGFARYCLHASRGEQTGGVPTLFSGFSAFWRVLSLYLLMGIFAFLWSLLLIIPGIVKAFSYSQATYILMDHPDMTAMECITASKEMMRGYKWDLFVLILSFIGWEILSAFTFGLLQIWLQPYAGISFAGFYNGISRWQPTVQETPADDRPGVDDYWKS